MKKQRTTTCIKLMILTFVLAFSVISCKGDDDECLCRGSYTVISSGNNTEAPKVNCDTGEPFVSIQAEDNPVVFNGCID